LVCADSKNGFVWHFQELERLERRSLDVDVHPRLADFRQVWLAHTPFDKMYYNP
jgi:hypothetical protein